MEKIKGFQISSMTVSGFKCYEAPMEITFGNPTIVTGGNGQLRTRVQAFVESLEMKQLRSAQKEDN